MKQTFETGKRNVFNGAALFRKVRFLHRSPVNGVALGSVSFQEISAQPLGQCKPMTGTPWHGCLLIEREALYSKRKSDKDTLELFEAIMDKILNVVLGQWPSLAAFIALGSTFWVLFKRHLDENRALIDIMKSISSDRSDSLKGIIEQYKVMVKDHSADADKYRLLTRTLVEENEKIGKRYDDLKHEFSKVMIENNSLKRAVDRIEEMMRATGSDVKVISKELGNARKDIDAVSQIVFQLPSPRKSFD